MQNIYGEIVASLEQGERLVLATLISRVGSAPRGAGAKYLVKSDGKALGSIGGGCVEAEVWQEAQQLMDKGKGKVLHFSLTSEQLAEGGLICGGDVDILLEPMKPEYSRIYQEVCKIKQKGGSGILATVISIDKNVPDGAGSKALMKLSGEKVGSLVHGEDLERRVLEEGGSVLAGKIPKVLFLKNEREGDGWREAEVLVEPIASEPTVHIFGGGHISQEVAPLTKRVGFKVVVIDDREIFSNRERFPEADEVLVSEFEGCFDLLKIDDSSYIVIVTRGHLYDGVVLEQAVKTDARYIGMIGSKKKIGTLYQNLIRKGVPKEALGRVHAPIGLDINSETPEEIAVSIVAQLIQVRGSR